MGPRFLFLKVLNFKIRLTIKWISLMCQAGWMCDIYYHNPFSSFVFIDKYIRNINMSYSSAMRLFCQKVFSYKIELMRWCNRMVLLAISTDKGMFDVLLSFVVCFVVNLKTNFYCHRLRKIYRIYFQLRSQLRRSQL